MTSGDALCLFAGVAGFFSIWVHSLGIRKGPPPKVKNDLFHTAPKTYPSKHWKDKVASSCMNCKHTDFIKKHWFQDRLYCENCKSTHKGKIAKHYLYDEAMSCMKCGHKDIPKGHEDSEIKCMNCKMGHYNFYNNNVLKGSRK